MDERYRLVFRGEVLDGHHLAVVKKKLAQALGIKDNAKLEQLFAGKPVVIRKDADTKTAAKFQGAFKKSGARLRVLPVVLSIEELEAQDAEAADRAEQERAEREHAATLAAMPKQVDFSDTSAWAVMPAGSPVLAAEEREEVESVEVPTDHISMDTAVAFAAVESDNTEVTPKIEAPDFDVAAVGSVMAPVTEQSAIEPQAALPDADFSVADVGEVLVPPSEPVAAPQELTELDFNLAEPGADIGATKQAAPPPPMPDVSHLDLVPEESPESEPPATRGRAVFTTDSAA